MILTVRMMEQDTKYFMNMEDNTSEYALDMRVVQPIPYVDNDYTILSNKPSINNVTLIGDLTSEDLGISASFPDQGLIGDVLMKTSNANDGVSWVTPASNAEQDNTRPITAAAVYTEIGNINALLATI